MADSNQPIDGGVQIAIDKPSNTQSTTVKKEMDITTSLEDLQTEEQRRVLDTVAQVRKCGLESILSLPQLVVCGDQSSGKSSVLEALTEIPFPRNDNLCTRFATEISLRRATNDSLTIKIIPDSRRPSSEQASIKEFQESITDFSELPRIMDAAKAAMDKDNNSTFASVTKAFAKDVLSIEIGGPTRPQLTLVDIPGLIHTHTKGVTDADVGLVVEITDQYIKQSRTICLAVVSASYDYANQKILTKVRQVDPEGDRTLGIITKPDAPPAGSGQQTSFLELARNEDIFFKLGWHVVKNRKFVERDYTLRERNEAENEFFLTSKFNSLPTSSVGIDKLRVRLAALLFNHVKQELPKLRSDLEAAMAETKKSLETMGNARSSAAECKAYLSQLSLDCHVLCKAAVNGHYEGIYFATEGENDFNLKSASTIRRIRAVVQYLNTEFAGNHRINGHKYHVDTSKTDTAVEELSVSPQSGEETNTGLKPISKNNSEALAWVRQVLVRTRGKELAGNFNPLLVGELFWEQCSKWHRLAVDYLDNVAHVCGRFLDTLLRDKCPRDVASRLNATLVEDALKARYDSALEELDKVMEDVKSYPINYNHYYTDTISKRREERQKKSLGQSIKDATIKEKCGRCGTDDQQTSIDLDQTMSNYRQGIDPNMENISCEEALDCLYAIYKVKPPKLPLYDSH